MTTTSTDCLVLDLPLLLVNPSNQREHWTQRAKRAKAHREAICQAVWFELRGGGFTLTDAPTVPKRIVFEVTRPRRFDGDALQGALKHCRDGLADARLIDHDGPGSGHEFVYPPMQVGPGRVRITVTRR